MNEFENIVNVDDILDCSEIDFKLETYTVNVKNLAGKQYEITGCSDRLLLIDFYRTVCDTIDGVPCIECKGDCISLVFNGKRLENVYKLDEKTLSDTGIRANTTVYIINDRNIMKLSSTVGNDMTKSDTAFIHTTTNNPDIFSSGQITRTMDGKDKYKRTSGRKIKFPHPLSKSVLFEYDDTSGSMMTSSFDWKQELNVMRERDRRRERSGSDVFSDDGFVNVLANSRHSMVGDISPICHDNRRRIDENDVDISKINGDILGMNGVIAEMKPDIDKAQGAIKRVERRIEKIEMRREWDLWIVKMVFVCVFFYLMK